MPYFNEKDVGDMAKLNGYMIVEKYQSHHCVWGSDVDEFVQAHLYAGNGGSMQSSFTHTIDLTTGISAVGYGIFKTKKTWALGTAIIVANLLVTGIVAGSGNTRLTFAGLKAAFDNASILNCAVFMQDNDDTWKVRTGDAGAYTETGITAIANNNLLTIIATSNKILYYVNRALVATHISNIPSAALYVGASVHATDVSVNPARQIKIDMLEISKYPV